MKFKKKHLLIILLFIIMIANPTTTTNGAAKGLLLWFNSVIPSLLPMLIVTGIITCYYNKLLKNPDLYIIILGLFCGYPIGAVAAAGFEKNTTFCDVQKRRYQLLLAACNTSSPAFIMNYIYASALKSSISLVTFLTIIYLPVFLLIGVAYLLTLSKNNTITPTIDTSENVPTQFIKVLDTSIMSSFETITKLGGYIILFSIIAAYIPTLPIKNALFQSSLSGFLEITTGINYTQELNLSVEAKTLLILVINAFGGLSCAAQTNSVVFQTNYSIKKYIYHKIILAVLTGIVGYFMIYVL